MPTPKPVRPSTPPVRTQPCASGGGEAVPVNKQDAPDVESGRPMSAEYGIGICEHPCGHLHNPQLPHLEEGGCLNWKRTSPAEQPQDPLPPLDNATVEDLSNAWNGEVAKRTKPWSQKALTLAFAIRERQLRASLAENTRLREALAEHRLAFGYTTYNGNTMEDCLKMAREEIAALAKREVSK
jgi:hypothetical protein